MLDTGEGGRCRSATDGRAWAGIPPYLEKTYWWAYLRPASIGVFDHPLVVAAILWGNYRRLTDAVLAEIAPGRSVLQMAAVYGDLSQRLARHVGPEGTIEIVDAAPIQVANAGRKLAPYPWATVRVADAARLDARPRDCVLSFFLLHELPDAEKHRAVAAALAHVAPGGRAIFVDYHRPARWHPVRPVMAAVFALLEPFAARMWTMEIAAMAAPGRAFHWRKATLFGGLYQLVIAERGCACRD